jgi:hypothetical protein
MIIDDHFMFARNESIAGAAGTALVGAGKTLGGSEFRAGSGNHLKLAISVSEEFAGAGTIDISLVTDEQEAIATDGSATPWITFKGLAVEDFALNKRYIVTLPSGSFSHEAFAGVLITRGGTLSAGALNAFFTLDAYDWEAFPEGLN